MPEDKKPTSAKPKPHTELRRKGQAAPPADTVDKTKAEPALLKPHRKVDTSGKGDDGTDDLFNDLPV